MTHSQFLALLSEIATKHGAAPEWVRLKSNQSKPVIAARHELMHRLREAGLSRLEIAQKTGLSVRTVARGEQAAKEVQS